jgi:hypothetical protein
VTDGIIRLPTALAAVAAQENGAVLARSFLIAVVVMAPVALWQWARIRARRRAETAATDPAGTPQPATGPATDQPGVEPPAAGQGDGEPTLEAVVRKVGALAADLPPGASATVDLPSGLTVGGRPAPEPLVARLVEDALRRGGLEGGLRTGPDGTRVVECHRPPHGARLGP